MSNFKQNGIEFTISNNFQQGEKLHNVKGKISSVNYPYSLYEEDDASKLINAVEIDWNGAQLKNGSTVKATLNNTGEMLSILQTA